MGDVFIVLFPGIVIGGEGDECVGDFRFPREFGFGECGHADEITTPCAVHV